MSIPVSVETLVPCGPNSFGQPALTGTGAVGLLPAAASDSRFSRSRSTLSQTVQPKYAAGVRTASASVIPKTI